MLDVQIGPTNRGRSFISAALAACAGARSARLGLRLLQPGRWGAPGSLPTSGWERAAGTRGLGGGSCGRIAGLLLPSGGTSGGSRQWLRSASNREAALGPWSPGLFTRGIVTRTSACSAATQRRAPGSACEAPNGIDEAGRGMGGDDGRLGQRAEQRRAWGGGRRGRVTTEWGAARAPSGLWSERCHPPPTGSISQTVRAVLQESQRLVPLTGHSWAASLAGG